MRWRQILSLLIFIRARPFVSQVLFHASRYAFAKYIRNFIRCCSFMNIDRFLFYSWPSENAINLPFYFSLSTNIKLKPIFIYFFFFFNIIDRSNQVSIRSNGLKGGNGSPDDEKWNMRCSKHRSRVKECKQEESCERVLWHLFISS